MVLPLFLQSFGIDHHMLLSGQLKFFFDTVASNATQIWVLLLCQSLTTSKVSAVVCYSLSALIENKIFSVHGGLSPAITTLDQVREFIMNLYIYSLKLYILIMFCLPDTNNWSEARSTSWWCYVWPLVVWSWRYCGWLGFESPWCWLPIWWQCCYFFQPYKQHWLHMSCSSVGNGRI